MTHSQEAFSRDQMGPERAAAYDAELRDLLVRRWGSSGRGEYELYAKITWGQPLGRDSDS